MRPWYYRGTHVISAQVQLNVRSSPVHNSQASKVRKALGIHHRAAGIGDHPNSGSASLQQQVIGEMSELMPTQLKFRQHRVLEAIQRELFKRISWETQNGLQHTSIRLSVVVYSTVDK